MLIDCFLFFSTFDCWDNPTLRIIRQVLYLSLKSKKENIHKQKEKSMDLFGSFQRVAKHLNLLALGEHPRVYYGVAPLPCSHPQAVLNPFEMKHTGF